jgi:putative transposase
VSTKPVETGETGSRQFVRTFKRDYVRISPCPDARTVIALLPTWFERYNTIHPHSALGYRAPREFIAQRSNREPVSET